MKLDEYTPINKTLLKNELKYMPDRTIAPDRASHNIEVAFKELVEHHKHILSSR